MVLLLQQMLLLVVSNADANPNVSNVCADSIRNLCRLINLFFLRFLLPAIALPRRLIRILQPPPPLAIPCSLRRLPPLISFSPRLFHLQFLLRCRSMIMPLALPFQLPPHRPIPARVRRIHSPHHQTHGASNPLALALPALPRLGRDFVRVGGLAVPRAEVVLLVHFAGGVLVRFLARELEAAGGGPGVDDGGGDFGVGVAAFWGWGDAR